MLLGTLDANLLGNMLKQKSVIKACNGVIRAEQDFQPSYPLLILTYKYNTKLSLNSNMFI